MADNKGELNPTVYIKSLTWNRDSFGLFDYESDNFSKNKLKTTGNAKIARIKNDIHLIQDNAQNTERINNFENSKLLGCIRKEENGFVIFRAEEKKEKFNLCSEDNLWQTFKKFDDKPQTHKHKLKQGDIIKLGKMVFNVKEIKIESPQKQEKECNLNSPFKNFHIDNLIDDHPHSFFQKTYLYTIANRRFEGICRICYEEINDPKTIDFLISPCNCSGSVRLIHLNCLKNWLKNKVIKKVNNNCTSFIWKKYECELCHTTFPDTFQYGSLRNDLIAVEKLKENKNYIVLEYIPNTENNVRILHMIDFSREKRIKMGRDNSCDVRINDISVSRCHAFLNFIDSKIFLEDNDSKFGTLVLIKRSMHLKKNEEIFLQIGKSLLSISLKDNFTLAKRKLVSMNSTEEEIENNFLDKEEDLLFEKPRKIIYKPAQSDSEDKIVCLLNKSKAPSITRQL